MIWLYGFPGFLLFMLACCCWSLDKNVRANMLLLLASSQACNVFCSFKSVYQKPRIELLTILLSEWPAYKNMRVMLLLWPAARPPILSLAQARPWSGTNIQFVDLFCSWTDINVLCFLTSSHRKDGSYKPDDEHT